MNNDLKRLAAEAAMVELDIKTGQELRIGLGTGSTAKHFVDLLGARVASGFKCICVPTSEETARQASALNIPLSDLDKLNRLDITIDGTDEITTDLHLIKGGGGALLREKIVAAASDKMVVIADISKKVDNLGAFALPIEVNSFGLLATKTMLEDIMVHYKIRPDLTLRLTKTKEPFVTDNAHFILDACFGRILDARGLSTMLLDVPVVVQHGLFLDLCQTAYIAGPEGVNKIGV
jgi:ribose 5-phosphate isomerase A